MNDPFDPALVVALCRGPWRVEPMAIRVARAGGRLLATAADRQLAATLIAAFPAGADVDQVAAFVATPVFGHWWPAGGDPTTPQTATSPGPLVHLTDVATLAAVLDVPLAELQHLARWHRPDADTGPIRAQHYRYLVRPTRAGGVRVLEAPKERLKEVQRRVLRRVVEPVPVHLSAHGSAAGRGVLVAIGANAAHDVVVSLDIERFSPR